MIMFSTFFIAFLQVIATKMSLVQVSLSTSFSIPVCFVVVVVVFFFLHFLLFHIK